MVRAIGLPAVNVRGNNIIKAKTKAEATGKGKGMLGTEKWHWQSKAQARIEREKIYTKIT